MKALQLGEKFCCPLCGAQQEGNIEDYVVPGYVGEASQAEDECDECGAAFSVTCINVGQFEVLAL